MIKSKFVFLYLMVILFIVSCNSECNCPSCHQSGIKYLTVKYDFLVDELSRQINGIKLHYGGSGQPYIVVSTEEPALYLYYWNKGWNKKKLLDKVLINDFDFYLKGSIVDILYSRQDNMEYSIKEVKFDTQTGDIYFNDLLFSGQGAFLAVYNHIGDIYVPYIDGAQGNIWLALKSSEMWSFEQIDDGSKGLPEGSSGGTIYYSPKITGENINLNLLYYDASGPRLKLANLYSEGGWKIETIPMLTDMVPGPNYDLKLNRWGGIDIAFQEQSKGDLYYAIYATGWQVGPIISNNELTGYNIQLFEANDSLIIFYYNLSRGEVRYCYKLHPFFNNDGIKKVEWKEEIVSLTENPSRLFSVSKALGSDKYGIVLFDVQDKRLIFKEVSFGGL